MYHAHMVNGFHSTLGILVSGHSPIAWLRDGQIHTIHMNIPEAFQESRSLEECLVFHIRGSWL